MVIQTIVLMWIGCWIGMLLRFAWHAIIRGQLLDPWTELDGTAVSMVFVLPFGIILGLLQ